MSDIFEPCFNGIVPSDAEGWAERHIKAVDPTRPLNAFGSRMRIHPCLLAWLVGGDIFEK